MTTRDDDDIGIEGERCERCCERGVAYDEDGRFLCEDCIFGSMTEPKSEWEA